MGDLIQFIPKSNPSNTRSTHELFEIGMKIITSSEFQEAEKNSGKPTSLTSDPLNEWVPYDPVAVAIMHGYYEK